MSAKAFGCKGIHGRASACPCSMCVFVCSHGVAEFVKAAGRFLASKARTRNLANLQRVAGQTGSAATWVLHRFNLVVFCMTFERREVGHTSFVRAAISQFWRLLFLTYFFAYFKNMPQGTPQK